MPLATPDDPRLSSRQTAVACVPTLRARTPPPYNSAFCELRFRWEEGTEPMAVRVGINGFGRIGRLTFRVMASRPDDFEVVAINDLADPRSLAMLLKYDSVHGRFNGTVEYDDQNLIVNGRPIRVLSERDPAKLPWGKLEVAVALESTGIFTKRADADSGKPGYDSHLAAGASRVVLSAPAKDKPDLTLVMGVNDSELSAKHRSISNASCTTNCLAPMAKVLDDNFGIVKGLMTTVHAYTNDQRIADLQHSDPRRARAAALNIIPTSTGAAKAVGEVIPRLKGKLTGMSMRVPVADGSVTDLTVLLAKKVDKTQVNAAMREAATGPLKGIMEYTEEPIVSSDIIGNSHSCIFDAEWTTVIEENLVKVIGWYDNEWGYSARTADLILRVAQLAAVT
jgi:glyceraldehyde 3-phosphate dehydrogenase